jgi:hypothetical protein
VGALDALPGDQGVDAVLERRPHLPLPPRLAWAPMRSMVACTAAVPSTSRTPRRRGGRRCTAVYQPTPPALPVAGGWYGREAGCAGPRRLVGGTPSASLSARSLGRVQRQGNRTGACDGRNGEVGEGLRGARSELWEHGREPPPRRGGRLGDARHRRREPSSPPSPTRCASASSTGAPTPVASTVRSCADTSVGSGARALARARERTSQVEPCHEMWTWAPQSASRGAIAWVGVGEPRAGRRWGCDQPGDDAVMPPPGE